MLDRNKLRRGEHAMMVEKFLCPQTHTKTMPAHLHSSGRPSPWARLASKCNPVKTRPSETTHKQKNQKVIRPNSHCRADTRTNHDIFRRDMLPEGGVRMLCWVDQSCFDRLVFSTDITPRTQQENTGIVLNSD